MMAGKKLKEWEREAEPLNIEKLQKIGRKMGKVEFLCRMIINNFLKSEFPSYGKNEEEYEEAVRLLRQRTPEDLSSWLGIPFEQVKIAYQKLEKFV